MNIIMLGPPGAGKGTQAKRLEAKLHIVSIASGDIFRAIRRDNTELGRKVREIFDRGDYVPDPLTIELVFARLDKPDAQRGFILDGFPRTLVQAESLDQRLASEGKKVDLVLHISAPTETLVDRICNRIVCPNCNAIFNSVTNPPAEDNRCDVCGHDLERRSDSDPEVVSARLELHKRETQPLADYYGGKGALSEIDGTRSFDEVNAAVDSAVAQAFGVAR